MSTPRLRLKTRLAAGLLLFGLLTAVWGESLQLPAPGPRDTCPVCGMFVSLYPDWVAQFHERIMKD